MAETASPSPPAGASPYPCPFPHPGGKGGTTGRGALLLVNIVLAAAYLWAASEALPVRVAVDGDRLIGEVSGTAIEARVVTEPEGQAGLYLAPPVGLQYVGWTRVVEPVMPSPALIAQAGPLLGGLWWQSGWGTVTIAESAPSGSRAPRYRLDGQRDGSVSATARYLDQSGIYTPPGAMVRLFEPVLGPGSVEIIAQHLRGYDGGGILVGAREGTGYIFSFRPVHRDAAWWSIDPTGWHGPLANGVFDKPWLQSLQEVTRQALRGYPAAVGLLVVASLAALLAHFVEGARGRPSPPAPSPNTGGRGGYGATGRGGTPALPLALLFICAFVITGFASVVVLEGMPHVQDSVAYHFQAKVLAAGRLFAPLPATIEFFEHEFVVMHDGRWFGKYPPGWPALLALGVLVGQPALVNPLVGALGLVAVYFLGRELYSRWVGLGAAVLGLSSPFFVFMSGSMMAHPAGMLFTTLGTLGFVRTQRTGSWPAATATGATFATAFLIRPWSAIVVVATLALFELPALVRSPGRALRWWPAVVVALPFVAAYLGYNDALTGNPLGNTQELWWSFDRLGFGPGHGPWPAGHTPLNGIWNTSRNLSELHRHLFGWPPALTLSFLAVPFVLARPRRADLLLAAAFASIVIGYWLWWADGIMYGPRFYYEGLAFLLILTARGVEAAGGIGAGLASWLRTSPAPLARGAGEGLRGEERGASGDGATGRRGGAAGADGGLDHERHETSERRERAMRRASRTVALGAVSIFVAANLTLFMPVQWTIHYGYNYVNGRTVSLVRASGVQNAVVFVPVGEWYAWWNYGSVFSSNSPFLDSDVLYARDLGDERNRRLVAAMPDRAFYRIQSGQVAPYRP
ncbi:MAG: glycosyltransferase family 39 protein [Chloroflexi bacterium]|nr:glycosyltransferase family 39 protein [Chloroflexota bacterium]